MKHLVIILSLALLLSCNSNNTSENKDPFKSKIENYIKAKTPNPDTYESLAVHDKTQLLASSADSLVIKECFNSKYGGPLKVDFNAPENDKAAVKSVSEIKEKFYSVVNEFKAQNKLGAIVNQSAVVYVDAQDSILSFIIFAP